MEYCLKCKVVVYTPNNRDHFDSTEAPISLTNLFTVQFTTKLISLKKLPDSER